MNLSVLGVLNSNAQTLERYLISPLGDLSYTADYDVAFTLGEVVVTTVHVGNLTVTQGFQQGDELVNAVFEVEGNLVEVNAFPNPFTTEIQMEIFVPEALEIIVQVFDVSGKSWINQKLELLPGKEVRIIDFLGVPSGAYFLVLRTSQGKLLNTIEIQKM